MWWYDDNDAVALEISGADAGNWLQALLTQHVPSISAGTWKPAMWLDEKAAPVAEFRLARTGDTSWSAVVHGPDDVTDRLKARVFIDRVTITPLGSVAFVSADVVADAGSHGAFGQIALDGGAGQAWGDVDGVWVAASQDALDAHRAGLDGVTLLDEAGRDALDLAAARPRVGHELVGGHTFEETGLLPTHGHLDKGCYPGQEVVARQWIAGSPRSCLVVADVDVLAAAGIEGGRAADGRAFAWVPNKNLDAVAGAHVVGGDADIPGRNPAIAQKRLQRT